MTRAQPLPPSLGDVFAVRTARAHDVGRSRLRARDLDSPFWGIRSVAGTEVDVSGFCDRDLTDEELAALRRIVQFAPRMSEDAFLSHASAALAWGVPLPLPLGTEVHVSVLRPRRAPRGAGVCGHQLVPRGVIVNEHNGLRLTNPATTWAQLAACLPLRDLVAAGDALVAIPRDSLGRKLPPQAAIATKTELEVAACALRRIGGEVARTALDLVRIGSSSRPETHLRLALVDSGLPEPELDVDILDRRHRKLGHSELAYPPYRVVVEYEGDHHRTSRKQWNRDIAKYEAYAAAGWTVVRITAEHLYTNPAQAPARVCAALLAAGWRP